MNSETIESVTKELISEIQQHYMTYDKAEQASEEFNAKYKKLIVKHIKTISKMKLFSENVLQLKETIIAKMDKKYLPKMKIKRPKPELTDEQISEKKEKARLKREQLQREKESGNYVKRARKEKFDENMFVIPILHSLE